MVRASAGAQISLSRWAKPPLGFLRRNSSRFSGGMFFTM